ncbi:MAG TPA: protein kinase [Blastocatellia bacterium]|nr:protein kinase [Blastocatellia bacterium]
MTPERWRRIDELFRTVAEQPTAERGEYLTRVCGDDADLRREVLELLAHEQPDSFLHDPIKQATLAVTNEAADDLLGRHIGPYRLTRLIGRGGMGAVYEAVRDDDQFQQRVALKLIKRGMDSDFVRERFLRERQILASLEHPHIARLFDGGATAEGLPYFVMEFVEGEPITDYCRGLSLDAKLKLFRDVCAAVQHAHQKLVVHRDLKPSNIMVTASADGKGGTPKLLDFGIAKLLSPDPGEAVTRTETAVRLMTPDYASPEQVRGETITTASDVYSLGIVLYELLTGRRPYQFDTYAPQAIERVVCDTLAPPPSEAARTGAAMTPARQLEGDLDNIVMMALRKEPERRYQSVEQFSDDLRRYLSGLPITARPDTFGYRTSKFVRRNRVAVLAAALVLLSLLGGIAAATRSARQARAERTRAEAGLAEAERQRRIAEQQRAEALTQRERAETETIEADLQRQIAEAQRAEADAQRYNAETQQERAERRFAQVRKLSNTFLFGFHDKIQNVPGTIEARELVAKTAMEYLDSLSQEANGDVQLEWELAVAYQKVGDVQGDPWAENLGKSRDAMQSYQKSLALAERLNRNGNHDLKMARLLAQDYFKVGILHAESGGLAAAHDVLRRAVAAAETLEQQTHEKDDLVFLQNCHIRLGDSYLDMGDPRRALEHHRHQMRLAERRAREFPNEVAQFALALAYSFGPEAMISLGQVNEARAQYEQSLALLDALLAKNPTEPRYQRAKMIGLIWLGNLAGNPRFINQGDTTTALRYYRQALAIAEQRAVLDARNARAQQDLAGGHRLPAEILLLGQPAEIRQAVEHFQQALGIVRALSSDKKDTPVLRREAQYLKGLGDAFNRLGDRAAALQNLKQALQIRRDLFKQDAANLQARAELHANLLAVADLILLTGDNNGALELYNEALAVAQTPPLEQSSDLYVRWRLADSYAGLSRYHAARAAVSPAAERPEHWREARRFAQQSFNLWDAWSQHAPSTNFNLRKREQAARSLADCEAALNQHRDR